MYAIVAIFVFFFLLPLQPDSTFIHRLCRNNLASSYTILLADGLKDDVESEKGIAAMCHLQTNTRLWYIALYSRHTVSYVQKFHLWIGKNKAYFSIKCANQISSSFRRTLHDSIYCYTAIQTPPNHNVICNFGSKMSVPKR